MSVTTAVVFFASTSLLLAAQRCPADFNGHPLKKVGGVGLYLGDPRLNQLQAPDASTVEGGGRWHNLWTFPHGSADSMTAICHYDGTRETTVFRLSNTVMSCRQDPTGFVCQ